MWQEITGPVKRFAGTTGTVTVPKGASILHIVFAGGSCAGFPDGQGGVITITGTSGSGFDYDPDYVSPIPSGATLTFSGTSTYFVDVMSPNGF
jgi:hypothetical protein